MFRSTILISCFCLIGCNPALNNPAGFKGRQEQLFYKINHKRIYQSCQQLMLMHRQGKLSYNTFYLDDTADKLKELPKPIRSLQPTYVRVDDMMLDIAFYQGSDGTQILRCSSNEFGQAKTHSENSKGLGFRNDPFGMDRLSGEESLDYLNENYEHFQMELIPGLTYERYKEQAPSVPKDIKQEVELMNMLFKDMRKVIAELAVKKQRLLYQTNHDELLKACRLIITRFNDNVFSKAKINIRDDKFAKDLKHIPEIILNLEPVYVWLEKDRVVVALIGGLDHAGVMAYMDNSQAVAMDTEIELTNGLLYYDDGLREADDDYKDYLNDLKNEAIPYLDWKRKQMNLPILKK